MYTVFVQGLEFYAHHGVPDEEQVLGHRYRADIWLEVEGAAPETDDVADTVDYARVCALTLDVSARARYRTVERLCREIGEALLWAFDRIVEARVTIAKLLPPAPVIVAETGVEMVFDRERLAPRTSSTTKA
jgi:7,8-dihydroneopterin aldolase/epimerase/oxygenase